MPNLNRKLRELEQRVAMLEQRLARLSHIAMEQPAFQHAAHLEAVRHQILAKQASKASN